MNRGTYRVLTHYFAIEKIPQQADDTFAIIKRDGFTNHVGILYGAVFNDGSGAFTFSVQESSDNGNADPYANVTIRSGGAGVSSVAVVGGGIVEFVVEWVALFQTSNYLRFRAVPASGAGGPKGVLALSHAVGAVEFRTVLGNP